MAQGQLRNRVASKLVDYGKDIAKEWHCVSVSVLVLWVSKRTSSQQSQKLHFLRWFYFCTCCCCSTCAYECTSLNYTCSEQTTKNWKFTHIPGPKSCDDTFNHFPLTAFNCPCASIIRLSKPSKIPKAKSLNFDIFILFHTTLDVCTSSMFHSYISIFALSCSHKTRATPIPLIPWPLCLVKPTQILLIRFIFLGNQKPDGKEHLLYHHLSS